MKQSAVVVFAMLIALIGLTACSSSDPYEPQTSSERPRGTGGAGFRTAGDGAGILEFLPPASWWRDPLIAEPVSLTSDQVASLEKIATDQGDEVNRLMRDSQTAVRQLREALNVDQAKSDDITAAGQRLRALSDDIFDRQLRMLASEREVLTAQQWSKLQTALQNERTERQQQRRGSPGTYPGGRGRGGFGGRRPGWGY